MKFKIYSSGYLKTTTKGQAWIPAFLTIGFLLAFPVAELIIMGNWAGTGYSGAQVRLLYENLWRDGFAATGFAVAVLAAVFNGISQFWYLYSSRKVDFYHCLPIKRSQFFLHKLMTGILYYAVPYLAMEFLAVLIGAMRGCFSLHLMKLAFLMFLLHLLLYLMIYFAMVLVICLTGNLLMGGLLLAAVLFYGPCLHMLLSGYRYSFFKTFAIDSASFRSGIFDLNYATPLGLGLGLVEQYGQGNYGAALLACAALTVFLAAASYAAFVKRPSERTGKALVFRFTEEIVRLLVVVPAGLGVGYIFYMLPSNSAKEPWWIFGMVLGTILCHGILEVIYRMDFRKFFCCRPMLLAAGAVVALCACIFRFDLLGYDQYVPKQEKLQDITIDLGMFGNEHFDYIKKQAGGHYSINEFDGEEGRYRPGYSIGVSQEAYKSIKKIVEASSKYTEPEESGSIGTDSLYYYLNVQYKMKSGSSVFRAYHISKDRLRELLRIGYRDGKLKQQKYSFLELDPGYLSNVAATFADGRYYSLFQEKKEEQQAFLEAFRKDVEEADAEVLTGKPCIIVEFYFDGIPLEEKISRMVPNADYHTSEMVSMYVYPEFKRTLAILSETGYPLSMDEIPVQSVEIRYYTNNAGDESETVTYDSEGQIKEIKKAMAYSYLTPSWLGYRRGFSYLNVTVNGEDTAGDWSFTEEDYPEFMREDEEKAREGLLGAKQEPEKEAPAETSGEIEVIEESGVPAEQEN